MTEIIKAITNVFKLLIETIKTAINLITKILQWISYAINIITTVIPTSLMVFVTLCIMTCVLLRVIGRD